ncbi:hypothetical protein IP84_06770 [beta proteobacterium AAP99]|nr:hypothetical protein IP84_06770 [beta proteobacterium AAP99]
MNIGITEAVALAAGLGWASGFRLYAALLIAGLLQFAGLVQLPPALQILAHPVVLGASGVMAVVEFMADKMPGVDSLWDAIHTFIRVPAGAILAYAAIADLDPAWALAAAIVGGTLAAGTHAAKAGTRAAINTSPEPFSNWGASLAEDVTVLGGAWLVWQYPLVFLGLLFLFVLFCIWWVPKVFRFVRAILRRVGGWLGFSPPAQRP